MNTCSNCNESRADSPAPWCRAHDQHRRPKPEYEVYPFSDVAEHLHAVRAQHHSGKPLTWTGPDKIHYSITAGVPEPSWHFSEAGMERNRDNGRGFWDAFIQVAFMFGWHNGVVSRENSNIEAILKDHNKQIADMALKALEDGNLDEAKRYITLLKEQS